jgi:hypothetical protein
MRWPEGKETRANEGMTVI